MEPIYKQYKYGDIDRTIMDLYNYGKKPGFFFKFQNGQLWFFSFPCLWQRNASLTSFRER